MSQIHEIAFEQLTNLYESMTTSMKEVVIQIARGIVIPNQTTLPRTKICSVGVDAERMQEILESLQELELVAEQGEQIQVQNADFFSYALARQVISDEGLTALRDQQISERIVAFERELQGYNPVPVTCLLLLLVNQHRCTSFLERLLIPENQNWNILGCLSNALPFLELDVDKYLWLAGMLERAYGKDMSRGEFFTGIQHTGKKKPEYAWRLIERIRVSIEDAWNYLPYLILGIAKNESEYNRCYVTVQQWIQSANKYLIQAGLYCLSEVSNHHESESLAVLEEHSYSPEPEIRRAVVLSTIDLFQHDESKCLNILKRLAQDKELSTRYEVANRLFLAKDKIPNAHQIEIAELYAVEYVRYNGILQQIGFVLAHIANEYPDRVLSFFKQWILNHHSSRYLSQPNNKFHHPLSILFLQKPEKTVQAMCEWLIEEPWLVKDAAMELMIEYSGPPLNESIHFRNDEILRFFRETTALLEPEKKARLIYVLSKLNHFPQNLKLLRAIELEEQEACYQALAEALGRIALDYPVQVKSELEMNWLNAPVPLPTIAQAVISSIEQYLTPGEENVFPPELYPERKVTESFYKYWNESMRRTSEEISRFFPLQQIFQRVQYNRGGRKFYVEYTDGSLGESEFCEFRAESSLPYSWVLDPDSYDFKRWLLLAKNQDLEEKDEQGTTETNH